jgi:methionine synthase II (cobalamin-independent)
MYSPPQTIETKVAILEEKIHTTEQLMQRIESAIEKISEVNANVTKMLVVHEEKINNGEKIEDILFTKMDQLKDKMDKDHTAVLSKLQGLEKKVWIGIGIVFCLSFVVRNADFFGKILTPGQDSGRIERLK